MTFEIIDGAYDLPGIPCWCRHVVKTLAGTPAHLIRDRLQAHRSKVVRTFLLANGAEAVFLPGYSPNLNPTEWLWAKLKGKELANFCAEDLTQAEDEARRGIR